MLGSLSVLCGQMLVVGLQGQELRADEQRLLASGERGGVVLFRRNVGPTMEGVAALNAAVAQAAPAELPPLVAVDQEGGRVMRLGAPALQLPPMRRLGDLADDALITRVAEAQARELAALGFTLDFAPVLDVHSNDANPITSSVSPDLEAVAKLTHIAPADARGEIIGSTVVAPGVIRYPLKQLGLCASITGARYTTTTEVYPDSPRATPRQCNDAQVAAVRAAIDFALAQ